MVQGGENPPTTNKTLEKLVAIFEGKGYQENGRWSARNRLSGQALSCSDACLRSKKEKLVKRESICRSPHRRKKRSKGSNHGSELTRAKLYPGFA